MKASMIFFAALFLFSAIILGASQLLSSIIKIEAGAKKENIHMAKTEAILEDIIGALRDDPNPETNSIDDPVWAWNGKTIGGYEITLYPLSDRLNPNFVRKNLFDKTRLSILLRPGKTSNELQQFREDHGLSLEEGYFCEFFEEDISRKFFSPYGWVNINLVDEFAARKLGTAITGSAEKGETLRERIQILLAGLSLADRKTLPGLLSPSYEEFYPIVNAEPLMNVNFVEPLILRELLAYPDYRIRHPGRICDEALSRRSEGGISADVLHTLLGIDKSNPLFYYLGCITWFWEIRINSNKPGHSLKAVVCRLPPGITTMQDPAELSAVYKIIERRFE